MIRHIEPIDYSTVAKIYNHYIEEGSSTMDRELKKESHIQQWIESFNNRERLYVYDSDEGILGWVILKKYSDRLGYQFAGETSIYLHPNAVGKKIGKQLKEFILKDAIQLKYNHLTAKIFAINKRSINFFKSFGYTTVGTQHKIGFINNQWMDIVILEKCLGQDE